MRDEKELYESECDVEEKGTGEAKIPEAKQSGHAAHSADAAIAECDQGTRSYWLVRFTA